MPQPTTMRQQPREVAKGVFQVELPTPFAVGPVNVYVLEGSQLTLVDTGPYTAAAWEALCSALEQLGRRPADIAQVVLTHHHVDHIGLLRKVQEVSGARSLAHPLAAPYVEMDKTFMHYHNQFYYHLYRENGVPEQLLSTVENYYKMLQGFCLPSSVDVLLQHAQPLPGLPEWQVLYTPGHAQSHLCLFRSRDQVLIGGDHILKNISSNAIIEPPRDPEQARALTLVQYRTSLEMCAEMEIQLVLPGHGEIVTDHRARIAGRLERNWERCATLRRLLEDGEKTAFQLSALLFPGLYEKELALTLSETLGHLDLLTLLHQLQTRKEAGVLYYSL